MRLCKLSAAAAVGLVGIVLFVAAGSADAATVPNGFEERTVAAGLSLPTAITWAPDGRMFVAEKKGTVQVVNPNGTIAPLLNISSHVYGVADRGLLGIAADSDFANNHWLYLLYVYNPAPAPSDLARTSRLTRVTVNDDNTVSDETVILGTVSDPPCPVPSNTVDCIPSDMDSHSIGTVKSAPDGTLWLGNGDASDWSKVDPLALRTYDEQSLAGKIIHIDRNGMGLPGHAFCPDDNDLTHVCTKLYAKGMRNPFRFTIRQGSGPVVGDVGWEEHEEIDLMTAPGRNYGWPCYEGPFHTSGYRDLSGCASEYAKEGTPQADTLPNYDYAHGESNSYQAAVVAGPQYTGGPYPADIYGDVFFGDYTSAFIKRMKLDDQGNVTSIVPFATGAVAVDIELGPGNEIYYADFGYATPGTGSVKRIVYTPTNQTPVPQATATPTSGSVPLDVSFSGAGTSDADGDPLTYEWDFGDGSAHSTERDPGHQYTSAGEYDATLTATDSKGAHATATVHVSAGNTPPDATIESPVDGSDFVIGKEIELRGSATDPEDGALTGNSLQWQVSLIHNSHTHDLTGLTGTDASFTAASDHDANSHYRITLIGTDSGGRSSTKVIEIYPRAVNFTLDSSPPGAPVTYAGATAAAPLAKSSAVDFVSSISAGESFTSGGKAYEFVGWSDGGARAHSVTIPSTDTTLTAMYEPAVSIEGETMSPTPSDGVSVTNFPDPSASGGDTITFRKSPSYATAQYTTGSPVDQVTLRMSGDQCQGSPVAVVSIDDLAPRSIDVVPATYTDFQLPLDPTNGGGAGTHTIEVAFDNDYSNDTCDRNLYLDKIRFHQVAGAPSAGASYVGPQGATPQQLSLVPAFNQCRSPNSNHGGPLSWPSCTSPKQASANLTLGTPDANGAEANMTARMSLRVGAGDVRILSFANDVRCLPGEAACGAANTASGRDYTGQLHAVLRLRITDRLSSAGATEPATTIDSPFRIMIPCNPTSDPAIGAICAVNTSVNAVVPGALTSGAHSIWQVGQVEIYDGGTDGIAATDGNTVFLTQGLYVP
jgi:glucose/arabinose dehydrogenase